MIDSNLLQYDNLISQLQWQDLAWHLTYVKLVPDLSQDLLQSPVGPRFTKQNTLYRIHLY